MTTRPEPECHCEQRIMAEGDDFDGMKIHEPRCPWLMWFVNYGEDA